MFVTIDTDKLRQAYNEGFTACGAATSRSENPYDGIIDTVLSEAWDAGWLLKSARLDYAGQLVENCTVTRETDRLQNELWSLQEAHSELESERNELNRRVQQLEAFMEKL